MKKWAVVVLLLYAAMILVFTFPVIFAAFAGLDLKVDRQMFRTVFTFWPYWAGFALFIMAQAALLDIHVIMTAQRPVTKRTIVPVIVCASLLMALLVAGIVFALDETIHKGFDPEQLLIILVPAASWVIWGVIFYRWSRKPDPGSFMERIRRTLFRGSILELLVAVPTHILARCRNYCCAGFGTFIGIVFGLAVMVCSFGPGVYFLFLERWQRLHPGKR